MEDLAYSGSDKDYNDMVVKITTNIPQGGDPVPDGGVTLMLLGGTLIGFGTLRRKFRV